MSRSSIEPTNFVFVKGDGFLSFTKNMCTNIGKSINKSLSRKYSFGMAASCQKRLDCNKQYAKTGKKGQSKRQQKQLVI